ncbi:hypothetical protein [Christensenella intestinihominis]|uniref:hypothetical protein n=1 Tax=Christensenella intestinihominis TaxID=1851429 RepID=UPI000835626C|nr:hypothetical protein [Christensenella intestinihominis]
MTNISKNKRSEELSTDVKIYYILLIAAVVIVISIVACARLQPQMEEKRVQEIVEKEALALEEISGKMQAGGLAYCTVESRERDGNKLKDDLLQIQYNWKYYIFWNRAGEKGKKCAEEILPEVERLYKTYGITQISPGNEIQSFTLGKRPVLHTEIFYLPGELIHSTLNRKSLVYYGLGDARKITDNWYWAEYPA